MTGQVKIRIRTKSFLHESYDGAMDPYTMILALIKIDGKTVWHKRIVTDDSIESVCYCSDELGDEAVEKAIADYGYQPKEEVE